MGRLDEAPEGGAIEAALEGAETAARLSNVTATPQEARDRAKRSRSASATRTTPAARSGEDGRRTPTAADAVVKAAAASATAEAEQRTEAPAADTDAAIPTATGSALSGTVKPELRTRRRAPTATSAFGVSRRESHDSSAYYESALYRSLPSESDTGTAQDLPDEVANSVIVGDSRHMHAIPDNTVHLMVTSPPYNVGKAYDDDMSLPEYLQLLRDVFAETWRVLVPGGRAVINVANLGRKPYIPLSSHINLIMHELGFLMRGEVIWDKSASAGSSCAWGSFKSASNPCLRDVHEYLLIFSKGNFKLPRSKAERAAGLREDTIEKEDFIEQTKSIWRFHAESAKRVNHPAPFPVELPRRCIEMYTFEGDVVLDPFMGSGSTGAAAIRTGRRYVGFDISEEFAGRARERLAKEAAEREQA